MRVPATSATGDTLPAPSFALASNVYEPSARPEAAWEALPPEHAPKAGVAVSRRKLPGELADRLGIDEMLTSEDDVRGRVVSAQLLGSVSYFPIAGRDHDQIHLGP